jgi:hypothetical protein
MIAGFLTDESAQEAISASKILWDHALVSIAPVEQDERARSGAGQSVSL